MGKDRDEVARLANASGRSLTVLRRQLSIVPAVQRPDWAADRKAAENLIPFLFVGAWNSNNEADRIGLSLLAGGRPYDELEKECQSLTLLNDAPVWSVGIYRGVVSNLDLVHAIASSITSEDLGRYFSMAQMVLVIMIQHLIWLRTSAGLHRFTGRRVSSREYFGRAFRRRWSCLLSMGAPCLEGASASIQKLRLPAL